MTQKHILIVEDGDVDRAVLKKSLEKNAEYAVRTTATATEALTLIAQQKPDLVLLDVMLPDSSGTETLIKIRNLHKAIDLPVIMVTSKNETKDVVEFLRLGASDFVSKPVNVDVLLSRIQTQLNLSAASNEAAKLREIAALDAMIATYNHEINNPLAIAIGATSKSEWQNDVSAVKSVIQSLWRIADIVKQIRAVSVKKDLEFENYAKTGKILKVKRSA
jgi:DNA-binding response OmpR family regulator